MPESLSASRHATRCITPGCGRFVYSFALWCRECEPGQSCGAKEWPPSCAPIGGGCCYVIDALDELGIDPYSGVPEREQYDALRRNRA